MNLYRPLEPKYKYDKYFPKVSCKEKKLGFGDTDFGIEQMAQWATKYSWQAKKIADKLKADTLLKTLENVHQFIYNNFQYLPDDDVQHIQSIACAWQSREHGINCKGYSTIASSILQQLGIRHYIRKVSYDGTNYTHVFVVVPVNNKEIIIDGTLPEFNHTTEYLTHKDLEVMPNTLKYVGLNAPTTTANAKDEFVNNFIPIAQDFGIQNLSQIMDFINSSLGPITINPVGILSSDNQFLPFHYKDVPVEVINQVVNDLFNNRNSLFHHLSGMNGGPFGGGSFGSSPYTAGYGAIPGGSGMSFGLDAGVTVDPSSGGNSGGATGAVWNGVANVLNAGANLYNAIAGNNNQPTQNTGGAIHYPSGNGGGSNTQPAQNYGSGFYQGVPANTGGGYQNTGVTGGIQPGTSPQAKKWYQNPVIIIPVALATAFGISKLTGSKSKK